MTEMNIENDIEMSLLSNVVLTGGASLMNGFPERERERESEESSRNKAMMMGSDPDEMVWLIRNEILVHG